MKNVYFVGRPASYRYNNTDQVVAQSLAMYKKIAAPEAELPVNGYK